MQFHIQNLNKKGYKVPLKLSMAYVKTLEKQGILCITKNMPVQAHAFNHVKRLSDRITGVGESLIHCLIQTSILKDTRNYEQRIQL